MEPRPHERGKPGRRIASPRVQVASMEPRPHERGKVCSRFRSSDPGCRLQWSHVLTNVERFRRVLEWMKSQASMEPRPHERGKGNAFSTPKKSLWLQWSHVLTNVERRRRVARQRQRIQASMEPRPHERGKSWCRGVRIWRQSLQWSHVLTNVERRKTGRRLSVIWDCFNGATSSRTWKANARPEQRRTRRRFNGATSSRTWKGGLSVAGGGRQPGLQWSHVLTNVESLRRRQCLGQHRQLQWSHVLTNVERTIHLHWQ